MTQTSSTESYNLYAMLTPGEVRTFHHEPTGITVKVFAVAGGGFTRLDVRARSGGLLPERAETFQFETDALRAFAATVKWLRDDV